MTDEDITQLFCQFKNGFVDSYYVSPRIKLNGSMKTYKTF